MCMHVLKSQIHIRTYILNMWLGLTVHNALNRPYGLYSVSSLDVHFAISLAAGSGADMCIGCAVSLTPDPLPWGTGSKLHAWEPCYFHSSHCECLGYHIPRWCNPMHTTVIFIAMLIIVTLVLVIVIGEFFPLAWAITTQHWQWIEDILSHTTTTAIMHSQPKHVSECLNSNSNCYEGSVQYHKATKSSVTMKWLWVCPHASLCIRWLVLSCFVLYRWMAKLFLVQPP